MVRLSVRGSKTWIGWKGRATEYETGRLVCLCVCGWQRSTWVGVSRVSHLVVFVAPQTERAYQKQPTIFQNKKRVLVADGGKEAKEKLPRYHKSVGLGFKTPREVIYLSY